MKARELFQAGKLDEAVQAALAEVRAQPTDSGARYILADLLCYTGDWQRVDKHLELLFQQVPELGGNIAIYRQLMRAAEARDQLLSEGRPPEFIDQATPLLALHLKAVVALREGNLQEAGSLLAQAEEQRPAVAGTADGKPFEDLRDMDDLTASFFEVLTGGGQYFWIAFDQVHEIEFQETPETLRDLLWRPAQIRTRGGPEGQVFVPALYLESATAPDDRLRLGRFTDWRGEEGEPIRGLGQRMLLVGDEDRPLMQLRQLVFQSEDGSPPE